MRDSYKGCSRKHIIPAFLLLFAAVIGLAVWIGVTTQQYANGAGGSKTPQKMPSTTKKQQPTTTASSESLPEDGYKLGQYRYAAVASDEERCSQIGTRMMARHCGSAIDAAIATMICVGVLNTHSAGIGGGSFMTVYDRANKSVTTFDFREEAPGAATANMYKGNSTLSTKGGLAIGVPGELAGYWAAHQKFGKLPWKTLFEPTITLCEEGFKIGPALSKAIAGKKNDIMENEQLREIFVDEHTGNLLKQGDKMYRAKLAHTLRIIAEEGANAFYNGSLSDDIVNDIKERNGIITRADLQNYRVREKEPVTFDIGGLKLYSVSPPSSGVVLGFILNILDGYKMKTDSLLKEPVLTYHRIIEAFKFAYAKRTDLGDENFVDIKALITNLTSEAYADEIRSKIWDNMTHTFEYYGPTFLDRELTGTAHASIMAPNGDAVAITSTINTHFGSKVKGRRTGIIFNNEMDDFSSPNITNSFGIPPSPANFIKPGKRPLSSMCPAIFIDGNGDVQLVVGASGGTKITTSTAYVSMRTLWFGDNMKKAIDARRIHHQLLPPKMQYESGFPEDVITELEKMRHNVSNTYSLGSSVVQGIFVTDQGLQAYSDFRKGGRPDGY